MDRALAAGHLNAAFGEDELTELPTVAELTELIAELEIELVRGASHTFSHDDYLAGRQTPVFFGSAINNFGVTDQCEPCGFAARVEFDA